MSTLDRAPSPAARDAVHDRRVGTGLIVVPVIYLGAAAVLSLVFVSGPPPRLTGHLDAFTLTGYALLAVAAIVLASTLPRRRLRWRWIAGLLIGMGVFSLVAFALHAAALSSAASAASGTSALFTLPVMALAIAEGRELRRSDDGLQTR